MKMFIRVNGTISLQIYVVEIILALLCVFSPEPTKYKCGLGPERPLVLMTLVRAPSYLQRTHLITFTLTYSNLSSFTRQSL